MIRGSREKAENVGLKFSVRGVRARSRIICRASVACGNLNPTKSLEGNSFSLLFHLLLTDIQKEIIPLSFSHVFCLRVF